MDGFTNASAWVSDSMSALMPAVKNRAKWQAALPTRCCKTADS